MINIKLHKNEIKLIKESIESSKWFGNEPKLCDRVLKKLDKALTIPVVVVPKGTLCDFEVWYKPCTRCGYDTAKSTKPKDGNKTCWKCGNFVQRDYTDRALKK